MPWGNYWDTFNCYIYWHKNHLPLWYLRMTTSLTFAIQWFKDQLMTTSLIFAIQWFKHQPMKSSNVLTLGDGPAGLLLGYGLRRSRLPELEWLTPLLAGIWSCRESRFFFVFRCSLMFFFKSSLSMNFITDSSSGFLIPVEYTHKYLSLVR